MTPVEQLIAKLEENHRTFKNANLLIAAGILEPTIKYAKELLVVEKMQMSTEFQKGYNAGYTAGKLEASITKV
jgi:hypothetical protein